MKNGHFYLDKIPGRQPRKDKDQYLNYKSLLNTYDYSSFKDT